MRKLIIIFFLIFTRMFLFSQDFSGYLANSVSITFDESNEGGSGFYYKDSVNLYLVTAKHVLFSKNKTSGESELKYQDCNLTFHKTSGDTLLKAKAKLKLSLAEDLKLIKISQDRDMLIIRVGRALERDSLNKIEKEGDYGIKFSPFIFQSNSFPSSGVIAFFSKEIVLEKVSEGSDILICGFPRAIGFVSNFQYDPDRPILRKGIVSALNNQKKTIIIDAASFGGNSGGAVLQKDNANGFKLIGMVTQNIPVSPEGRYVGNSGYSVVEPITSLLKLIENEK